MKTKSPLTPKRLQFIEFFLQTGDATKSAELAGYKGRSKSAFSSMGCELLKVPEVREIVDRRQEEKYKVTQEIIKNTAEKDALTVSQILSLIKEGATKAPRWSERAKYIEMAGRANALFTDKQVREEKAMHVYKELASYGDDFNE
tara:strand:- start:217 stop:651 length:435 start_codon:yes stop_codon:yes gene_type:complete